MKIETETIKYRDTERTAPRLILTAENQNDWNELSELYQSMLDMTDEVHEVLNCGLKEKTRQMIIEIAIIDKRLYMNPQEIKEEETQDAETNT